MITYLWFSLRGPSHLKYAHSALNRLVNHSTVYSIRNESAARTLWPQEPGLHTPLDIIWEGTWLGLSDPRDHVFAFLGLTQKLTKPLVTIQSDYEKSLIKTCPSISGASPAITRSRKRTTTDV